MKMYLFLFLIIILCSCQYQQPLCFDHDNWIDTRVPVKVIFDWSDCPDAKPSHMNLYLFPTDGRHYTRYLFNGRDGGTISVPPGRYAAVALNDDCENIKILTPESYETFQIALRGDDDYNPYSANSYKESICLTPGYLWTSWIDGLDITGDDITVKMSESFCRYSVEIINFPDIHRVSSIQGIIYGNHGALGFDGPPASDSGLLFDLGKHPGKYPRPNDKNLIYSSENQETAQKVSTDSGRFYGEFLTFGHCGQSRLPGVNIDQSPRAHILSLKYQLANGTTCYGQVDVTEQVHSQPTERCHIVLDTLKLPPSTGGTGGWNISISDWQTVNIDISAH